LVLIFWRNRQGFFLSAHASTPPLPGSSISKKQFSAETMLFSRENFYFSQKIHYKHENPKYLNNFHTFVQKKRRERHAFLPIKREEALHEAEGVSFEAAGF
jgi:hypothetical protein